MRKAIALLFCLVAPALWAHEGHDMPGMSKIGRAHV